MDNRTKTLTYIGRALRQFCENRGMGKDETLRTYVIYQTAVEDVTGIHFDDFIDAIGAVEREPTGILLQQWERTHCQSAKAPPAKTDKEQV